MDTRKQGERVGKPTEIVGESLTKQSFAEDCDVNKVMARWVRTGKVWSTNAWPQYGDFTNAEDYMSALNRCLEAQAAFDELPARVRQRFDNEPAKLLEFLGVPENRDEAIELGLVEREPEQQELVPVEPPADGPSEGSGTQDVS